MTPNYGSTAKKKVFLVITKSNWGGAQRYVYDLATNLPKDQFEVVVAFGQEGKLKDELDKAHIRTIPIKGLQRDVNPLLDIKVFFNLVSLFRKERPDIVHLNSSKIGGVGALAARIAGISHIIFTGHGWAFNENRSWLSKKIILALHWITILLSHTTIAVSNKTAADVSYLPFVKNKIKVIHNGISNFDILPQLGARERLLPGKPTSIWLGTVAELHPTKGLLYAIDAVAELIKEFPQLIYIILGEGEQRSILEARIKEKNLTQHVFLSGYVVDAKQYISAFDIFILPSLSEALAYVAIEAGYTKTPVIASHVGGLPEIIESEVNGILVPAQDSIALKNAITSLLTNDKLRMEFAEKLHSKVTSQFTISHMVTDTASIYNK